MGEMKNTQNRETFTNIHNIHILLVAARAHR